MARKKNYIHCNKTFPRTSSELAFRVSSENIQKKISASGFVTPVCATFTPLCNLYFRHAQHEASLHRGGESEDTGNRDWKFGQKIKRANMKELDQFPSTACASIKAMSQLRVRRPKGAKTFTDFQILRFPLSFHCYYV